LLKSICRKSEQEPEVIKGLLHDEEGGIGTDGIAIFGELPDWEADKLAAERSNPGI